MTFTLPKLPYTFDALEPFIDAKTMEIHHDNHHQAYVDNLNKALEKYPELQKLKIEELLKKFADLPDELKTAVKNHGGGHFNHSLFWEILSNNKKKKEFNGKIAETTERDFESFDKLKELLNDCAMKRLGSGWAWLVFNPNTTKLEIYSTANQDSPLMEGRIPLLGIDVWEHAFYLKYHNRKAEYVAAFWNIINWQQVEKNYLNAIK